MRIKRGHIESVKNYAAFFTKLESQLESISRYQNEFERLNRVIKSQSKDIEEIKAENEMLMNELLKKSDYIYKLEHKDK